MTRTEKGLMKHGKYKNKLRDYRTGIYDDKILYMVTINGKNVYEDVAPLTDKELSRIVKYHS